MDIGFKLATENRSGPELVAEAQRAEAAGFSFGFVSDHFHPWTDAQGESPFVWGVIGAIAQATDELRIVTGVTCPTIRIHPAIVAQAAATSSTLAPGRFALGVGSGENLNEHVLGDRWPPTPVRHAMLEEAVAVIRRLWEGGEVSHHGPHYTVENARLYSLPEEPPPLYVAAAGPRAAELAARIGDGLVAGGPDPEVLDTFADRGGRGPVHAEVGVCYAPDEDEARRLAHASWPNAALPGELGQELATPAHFEQATSLLDVDDVATAVTCGPDPERHAAAIREYLDAGITSVAVHQVAPGVEGFWDFYADEVLPRL